MTLQNCPKFTLLWQAFLHQEFSYLLIVVFFKLVLEMRSIKVSHVSWRNYSNWQDRFQYLVSTQSTSCVLLRVFLCNQESGLGSLSKEIFGVSVSYR